MFATVVRAAPLRASVRAMAPQLKFQPGYRIFTPETLPNFLPSVVGWGTAAAGFVTLYLSGVPKFKQDVLSQLPIVRLFLLVWEVGRSWDSGRGFSPVGHWAIGRTGTRFHPLLRWIARLSQRVPFHSSSSGFRLPVVAFGGGSETDAFL